jgi:hypothetical protein
MAVQRGCEGIEPAGYSGSGKATRDAGPSGGRLGSTPWWPNSLLELWLCRADGAGAAFEVPTLVDFTTITPPGSVNTGRTIRPR